MHKKKIVSTVMALAAFALVMTASSPSRLATAGENRYELSSTEPITVPLTEPLIVTTTESATTTRATTTSTTITTAVATTTVTTTAASESFDFSTDLVADVMHEFFAEKGYDDAQISGIVANAEIESGLQPSRSENGYFGLFQLMSCPRQYEMLSALEEAGLGKYTQPEYWPDGASNFDSRDDMERFVTIMLDYAMDPNDTAWQTELFNAQSPEEAAEIFLVHYERAVGGDGTIQCYAPYLGCNYQAAEKRRNAARAWFEVFTA